LVQLLLAPQRPRLPSRLRIRYGCGAFLFELSSRGIQMFPKPKSVLDPNTYAYEPEPMVKATGVSRIRRRWLFGKEINLMGIQALAWDWARCSRNAGRLRARFPRLLGLDQIRADFRVAGFGLQHSRHRPGRSPSAPTR
jgi:hypothetical protein